MKLITVTSALLALGETASASLYPRSNTTTTTIRNATYDYIVAGAGTAGIVAAERLAASGRSVLLVERGGPSLYMSGYRKTMPWNDTVTMYDVPGMSDYTGADPDLQYCRDLVIAAGCMLGGSTMLNALMFVRPRAADFAGWPEEWRWENGVALAAEEFYERLPGTILASEDGKRYDDGAYEIMSRFLDANGWSEQDALNDVEAKELMYSHPPWSVSRANGPPCRKGKKGSTLTRSYRSPTACVTAPCDPSSPTPRRCPTSPLSCTPRSSAPCATAAS